MEPLKGSEAAKAKRQHLDLIKKRGEAIHWMIEIESLLDEAIIWNCISGEYQDDFVGILQWEDFRLSTKVRLFSEIHLPDKMRKMQSLIVHLLRDKLLPTRNKFAHSPSTFEEHQTALIVRGRKYYEVTPKSFKEFKETCYKVMAMLRYIVWTQEEVIAIPKSMRGLMITPDQL